MNDPSWTDERWFTDFRAAMAAPTPEEARPTIDRMLTPFHDEGPWLLLYFQPDFYRVSDRIDWKPRRDEEIDLFVARLRR